jgi:hypothetical protein
VRAHFEEQRVEFTGLEDEFSKKVYSFFKDRISELYPLDPSPEDPLQVQREAHESFLSSRSETLLGRDVMLSEIMDYAKHGGTTSSPLLIIGTAGAGKSAVQAKTAADCQLLAAQDNFPRIAGQTKKWKVIFHFVGATPGSTDLAFFLQRLIKELKPDLKDVLTDLDSLVQQANSLIS